MQGTTEHRMPIQRRKCSPKKGNFEQNRFKSAIYRSTGMSNHCQKELDGNERNNAIERTKSTYRKKRKGEMPKQKVPDSSLGELLRQNFSSAKSAPR